MYICNTCITGGWFFFLQGSMGNQGSSSLPQQKYPPRSGEDSKVRSMEFRRQRSDQGDKQQKLYQPPNHKPMYWRILCNMINFCTMKWYLLRTRADWNVSIFLYRLTIAVRKILPFVCAILKMLLVQNYVWHGKTTWGNKPFSNTD